MMLADAINWPLFAALGLAVFGPLTLFVVLVECSVLRWFLGIPLRKSFRTILLANVVSTVAGCLIYAFQGILVHAWGLRTLYDFAHYYIWAALGLILLYYAKSVVVEGLVVARRRFSEVSNLRRRQLWRGVVVANAASYLFAGPLFYFTTRPTFEGARIVLDPAPVAACQDTVFYLDRERMLCAIRADGTGQRQVTTRPVENVWLDARCQTLVFENSGRLWSQKVSGSNAVSIPWITNQGIEFSATGRQVALCSVVEIIRQGETVGHVNDYGQWQDLGKLNRWTIRVFDLDREATVGKAVVEGHSALPPRFGWDAEDKAVLWCTYDRALKAFRLGPDGLVEQGDQVRIGELVRNLHAEDRVRGVSGPVDVQDDLKLFIWPYIGANMRVTRGETVVMKFRDDRGLLGSSWGGPTNGGFLGTPGKMVFQADGHVYVGDVATRTICALVLGRYQRLTPMPYVEFEQHTKEADERHDAASE